MSKVELQDAIMSGELNSAAIGIIIMGHAEWFEECETVEAVNEWAASFAKLFE